MVDKTISSQVPFSSCSGAFDHIISLCLSNKISSFEFRVVDVRKGLNTNLICLIVYVADCEGFLSNFTELSLGNGNNTAGFPLYVLEGFACRDNYWGGNKNRVIHVLPFFYKPKPRQNIVSAG